MKITHAEYNKCLDIVNEYRKQILKKAKDLETAYTHNEETLLNEADNLGVRIYNVLRWHLKGSFSSEHDLKVKDLRNITKSELSNLRNLGKKSQDKLEEFLLHCGIVLL